MEAEGSVGEESDLVVHALEACVGETRVDEGEDAVEVASDGTTELDEGWQPRALSPGEPCHEGAAGVEAAPVGEDVEKGLLEEVGSVERVVGPAHEVELGSLAGAKVLGVLEQGPPCALDRSSVPGIEQAQLSTADFGEGVVLVARDLTPSLTVQIDPEHVTGFATDKGTRTSHWVLLARSLEIPAVVGCGNISTRVREGQEVIGRKQE